VSEESGREKKRREVVNAWHLAHETEVGRGRHTFLAGTWGAAESAMIAEEMERRASGRNESG
jgi:hypothetical protein